MTFLLKACYYNLCSQSHLQYARKQLDCLSKRLSRIEDRWQLPYQFKGQGWYRSIRPMQSKAEIEKLFRKICGFRPKTVVEIGTCKGGTLYMWCQAAADDARIVSVDLPGGPFGGGYVSTRMDLYREFAKPGQKLHLIRGNSRNPDVVQQVKSSLEGRLIDFLYIDGDHAYRSVKSDFDLYWPLVKPGGILVLHDILERTGHPEIEVFKLWNELRSRYTCEEITEDAPLEPTRRIGVGILYKEQA